MLQLSPKFKEFILTETKRDFLEGTTAAGKTTVGIFKFMLMVAKVILSIMLLPEQILVQLKRM